jgi:hypothetical protein
MTAITLNRGDSKTYVVTCKYTSTGEAINITGWTVFFTVKKNTNSNDSTDTDAIIKKTITSHTDPTNGITTISLTSDDTDIPSCSYMYDIQVKDASGNIGSTIADKFNVRGDVTRRTS